MCRCLLDNQEQGGFGDECKAEVKRFEQLAAKDFRLNSVLRSKCTDTIASLCPDKCKPDQQDQLCGGSVLQCLVDGYEKIDDEACKNEVFYFMKMEVRDFRNDVIVAEMCREDVTKFCADVEPGELLARTGFLALLWLAQFDSGNLAFCHHGGALLHMGNSLILLHGRWSAACFCQMVHLQLHLWWCNRDSHTGIRVYGKCSGDAFAYLLDLQDCQRTMRIAHR